MDYFCIVGVSFDIASASSCITRNDKYFLCVFPHLVLFFVVDLMVEFVVLTALRMTT